MERYNPNKIESKWHKIWEEEKINSPDLDNAKRPFYNLMMFPYPSAEGLHVGNMYAFVHSDAYGRYMRLKGFDVFEPIGLDGFGIHSENYAIKVGEHILDVSRRTEKHFYEQLKMIGNQYDWDHTLETYKPEYYKWTQWIFIQMFKKGLAYQAESYVNWCPSCKTVLSDEQVISGKCERCASAVEKKMMKQWFFKITDYAERLLKNLEWINWSQRTKIAQRNWIGKSEGAEFEMKFAGTDEKISVFTTRLDTVFGMTYVVVAPEHPMMSNLKLVISNWSEVEKYINEAKAKSEIERVEAEKEKTGIELKGIKIVNPFNNQEIPVFVADYVLGHYGTGAVMAVPAHDTRDFEFAKKYKLIIKKVIIPPALLKIVRNALDIAVGASTELRAVSECFIDDGELIDSEEYSGLISEQAREKMAVWLEKNNLGGEKTNYKLRDWCISRQRYWGPPIPIIYCSHCHSRENGNPENKKSGSRIKFGMTPTTTIIDGKNYAVIPVPEKDLPVLLPETKDYLPQPDGLAPLARNEKFWKTKCPQCGGEARREIDVSDTFLDSSWYFFRYPSTNSGQDLFDPLITRKWLPVDMYIGGHEHAVLHLLYSRFVTMFFKDLGLIDFGEPYKRFFAHGLLISEGAKMSKSKGNIINPDEYVKKYGADAVRMYLMFLGDVAQGGDWHDTGIRGMAKFINKIWKLFNNFEKEGAGIEDISFIDKTVKKVGDDLERLSFNTAIARIMEYINWYQQNEINFNNGQRKKLFEILSLILAPFAPHISEELWNQLGHEKSIFKESWPKYNPELIKESIISLVIQINGKIRDKIEAAADISESDAKVAALGSEKIKNFLAGKEPKKVIFVKGKLVNIVA